MTYQNTKGNITYKDIIGAMSLFLMTGFLGFHFTNDYSNNRNILAIQESSEDYVYIGKGTSNNYHYIKDKNQEIKEYYISSDISNFFEVNSKITVYEVYYDYSNSNGLYQWIYDKILLKNELSVYETISFTTNV